MKQRHRWFLLVLLIAVLAVLCFCFLLAFTAGPLPELI
jgi:ABC-type transporter Mla subunit MlaD